MVKLRNITVQVLGILEDHVLTKHESHLVIHGHCLGASGGIRATGMILYKDGCLATDSSSAGSVGPVSDHFSAVEVAILCWMNLVGSKRQNLRPDDIEGSSRDME
jgi:hypothetical protein